MKQKIIVTLFFLLEIIGSFFAWQSFYRAVLVTGSSHFLVPSLLFSFLATLLLVSVILVPLPVFRFVAIAIVVLPVFLFGFSIPTIVGVIVASACFYGSLSVIDRELTEHLSVRFFSSARMGTFLLSLGLSITLVAGYSLLIATMSPENLLPRFSLADGTGHLVLQIAGKVNPALSRLGNENLSVDDFIVEMMPGVAADGSGDASSAIDMTNPSVQAALQSLSASRGISSEQLLNEQATATADFQKTLFLKETKRRIGEILGRDVVGSERATDVLSEMINAKIFGTFSVAHTEGDSIGMLRAILAILLSLSLLSVGSLFGFLWAFLSFIIFWILQGANIVAIRRIPVEAEQIILVD